MDDALFEQLLYRPESDTLDFKKEQYRFVKATDDEKSELLKDILGFANAWRRSEAYILIGVEEVRGGRANVVGIAPTDHLDDHSLQQFVNNLTNRPVQFHYEAFGFEGKQVGIIRIGEQIRPIYLKKDYGKLKKNHVYVRRGSSTDVTRPADPDEIARMGAGLAAGENQASLAVEFADPDREQALGDHLKWTAEFCEMPDPKEIPTIESRPRSVRLPSGQVLNIPDIRSLISDDRLNSHYYHQLAEYIFVRKIFKKVRLVVMNIGEVPASDVRLEIHVPNGQGIAILDCSEVPDVPKRQASFLELPAMKQLTFRHASRHSGIVVIHKNDEQTKVEIECGNLQPGRRVWTDDFFMGIGQSGKISLRGHVFAANLSQPKEFTLSINATITQTEMTVDELRSLDEPVEQDE